MKTLFKALATRTPLGILVISVLIFSPALMTSRAQEKEQQNHKDTGRSAKPVEVTVVDHVIPFDGNRIFCYIANNGDLVTDNVGQSAGFYWPSTPRTSRHQTEEELRGQLTADYSSGLWIAGLINGGVRTAIVEYTSEYIAGKILPDGRGDDATLPKYRIYKIMKDDGPGVKDWDEWPGADGAPLNPNGTPKLIGDQMLWFVMNDLNETRHQEPISGCPPIGLEVQTTLFGFNRADPLGDVMFVKWKVMNKGSADLDSAFVGLWDDPDLGYAGDDLIGCDTTLGLGFCYNGNPFDRQYNSYMPALGFDFLRGPEVPKGSGHFLNMTSFVRFGGYCYDGGPENCGPIYEYMNGLPCGQPIIDSKTGRVTKFAYSGDPVTRLGWLDSHPSDRLFLMSSGPFKLARGDTQEVIGAKIIAPGVNPSTAVTALRFFDQFAQSAFDRDFEVIEATAPKVAARRLNQEIVLTWLEGHETVESFSHGGYQFQGYRVYQGASSSGPFTPIATFDLADGLQHVFDRQFDTTSGLVLEKLVIAASDSGVQRYLSIRNDAVFNPGQRLSNYRDYYFAVTSYVIDLKATPRVIESPIQSLRVAPSTPDYGVSVETKTGTKINLRHDKGKGDGEFFYQVVDPALIRAASYRVTWNNDSTPEAGVYTWNLERNGERVLPSQPITGRDYKENPNDDAPIVDGLQIQILPASFQMPARIASWQQTVDVDPNDKGLRLWGGGSPFGLPDDLSSTFFGGGTKNLEKLQADLEFRFTGIKVSEGALDTAIISGGQLGIMRSRRLSANRAVVRLSFELWDIENNIQINVFVTDRNADFKSPWGDDGAPQYYRIRGRNYITPIYMPYNEATLTKDSFDRTDSNATWILFFHSGEQGPASEWRTGDRFVVHFTNPTIPGVDEYTFATTPGMIPGQLDLAKHQLQRINIVPNPYWAYNPMERDPLNRLVRITNLPSQGAKIRIFNLAGDLVRVIDDADRRTDGTSGLQHVNWDLRNDAGNSVGSGVYLIHVEVPGVGVIIKKAAVIMPVDQLSIF